MNSLIFKKIELSRATDKELSSVRYLDRTYFPFPWSSDNWRSSLENSSRYQLSLALVNQVVVGFSIFYLLPEDSFAHLQKIIISKSSRGEGVASKLLAFSLEYLKDDGVTNFYLEVESTNSSAINLYKRLQFSVIRTNRNYYGSRRDGVIMELKF